MRNAAIILLFAVTVLGCENTLTVDPTFDSHYVKYYGMKGDQEGRDMAKVADGFVLLGRTDSDNFGKQVYVVKTDFLGNQQWSMSYGGVFNEDPASIDVDANGNIIIATTVGTSNGTTDMVMYRLNSDGSFSDSLVYGDPSFSEVAKEAISLTTGDYMIMGTTDQVVGKQNAILIYRTEINSLTPLLQTFWTRIHGEGTSDIAGGIVESNGRYHVLGTSDSDNANTAGNNMLIFSLDGTGEQFLATFWGTDDDQTAEKLIDVEGGFVLAGTSSNGVNSNIIIQPVTESLGSSQAAILVPKNNVSARDIMDIGTGYVILGTEQLGVTDTNIYLTEIDKFGNVMWETTFGGDEIDLGASGLFQDNDGGVVFLGTVDLESQSKMALIKVNDSGLLEP